MFLSHQLTSFRILIKSANNLSSVDIYARCASHADLHASVSQELRRAVEDGVKLVQLVRQEAAFGVALDEFALSPRDLSEHDAHPCAYRMSDLAGKPGKSAAVTANRQAMQTRPERVHEVLGFEREDMLSDM